MRPPPTCVSPLTQFFAFLEDGIVIVEPARIRKRYLYSAHFWRDIISLVPLDVVAVIAGQYYIVPWLRMTKVKPFTFTLSVSVRSPVVITRFL